MGEFVLETEEDDLTKLSKLFQCIMTLGTNELAINIICTRKWSNKIRVKVTTGQVG